MFRGRVFTGFSGPGRPPAIPDPSPMPSQCPRVISITEGTTMATANTVRRVIGSCR